MARNEPCESADAARGDDHGFRSEVLPSVLSGNQALSGDDRENNVPYIRSEIPFCAWAEGDLIDASRVVQFRVSQTLMKTAFDGFLNKAVAYTWEKLSRIMLFVTFCIFLFFLSDSRCLCFVSLFPFSHLYFHLPFSLYFSSSLKFVFSILTPFPFPSHYFLALFVLTVSSLAPSCRLSRNRSLQVTPVSTQGM